MQGIAQLGVARGARALFLAIITLNGCAQSVPVSTVSSDNAAGRSGTAASKGTALSIAGSPSTRVVAGAPYSFIPSVTPAATALTFSVNNLPPWAVFNSNTGELDGTPPLTSVGTTSNITITASDGVSMVIIGPFAITVIAPGLPGRATLSWAMPTLNSDGTPLTDLAGYRIYHGTSPAQLSGEITVTPAATTSYIFNGLATGVHYFAITAVNARGTESVQSNVVSKTL